MVVVLCNCPETDGVAARLAHDVVERRLAACVNLLPGVRSFYRWEGRIEDDQECTLVMKTLPECLPALREYILTHHPYKLPEIVVVAVDEKLSHPAYLAWVHAECGLMGSPVGSHTHPQDP